MIKSVIRRLLGEKNVGRLDYLLKYQSKNPWGGPLNGQSFRQRIFSDIMSRIDFTAASRRAVRSSPDSSDPRDQPPATTNSTSLCGMARGGRFVRSRLR